jgi:hypothetical protein
MASVLAIGLAAAPAEAAVQVCNVTSNATPQCPSTSGNNVLITQTSGQNTVQASFNSGTRTFTGMFTAGEALNANASGQANLTAVDGAITGPLTFMLNGGTFTTATFDLLGTGSVLIQALFGDTVLGGSTVNLSESGTNFFGITATGSELFTGFRLTSQTGTLTEVRQVRLGGVQTAVPEPGTWALMLIGFGAIGVGMRRRRRSSPSIMQIA